MPRTKLPYPAYFRHKRSGRAYVTIDGDQKYLPGEYTTRTTRSSASGFARAKDLLGVKGSRERVRRRMVLGDYLSPGGHEGDPSRTCPVVLRVGSTLP